MSTVTLSFIVPVRDDAARLRRCLRSIAGDPSPVPFELIVADNGSTDDSPEVATTAGARVLSLPGQPVAELRNRAAAAATGDLLAFVDADHEIAAGWRDAAVQALATPGVCAAGAEYFAPPNGTWVQQIFDRFRRHAAGTSRADWLPSGNLVVRREAFDRVGGFDVSLESCEDVDLCRRLRANGEAILSVASLRTIHFGDPASLRALFLAELWRGRDNLRVSLRDRWTLRSAPSVVIPIVDLLAAAAVVAGLATIASGGWRLAIGGLTTFAALAVLRAVRLARHRPRGERALPDAARCLAVAMTYDAARALALVARAGHRTRRKADHAA